MLKSILFKTPIKSTKNLKTTTKQCLFLSLSVEESERKKSEMIEDRDRYKGCFMIWYEEANMNIDIVGS